LKSKAKTIQLNWFAGHVCPKQLASGTEAPNVPKRQGRAEPVSPLKCLLEEGSPMAKSKEPENLGECAYCPKQGTTKDHIPPQTIYAKGTQNKPWVPACQCCNGGASKDDEYMRRLAMLWGTDGSKDAAAAEERFFHNLINSPEAEGERDYQSAVLQSLRS
jgi:hypothetical protein